LNQNHYNKSNIKVYQRFLLYFTVTMLVVFLIISGILLISRNQRIHEYKVQSEAEIHHLGDMIESHFQSVKSDILFLPELNELIRYKDIKNDVDKYSIELEFLIFSRTKKIYDQIRYINKSGYEEIRVNYDSGRPNIIPKDDLQNKSGRYYFDESYSLSNGDIYVSPLDLNKENGEIEEPLKPIIRFGTPIINSSGEKSGVLILNYLAAEFLEDLKSTTQSSPGVFALMNEEGYWLYKDDPEQEWGFMYPDKGNLTMRIENLELWEELSSSSFTQLINKERIYTSLEIQPLAGTPGISNGPKWYLVNWICCEEFGISREIFLKKLLFYNLFAAFFLGFLTLLLARAVDQRNSFREALTHSALYDSLTNLPNRALLKSRIDQLLEELKRYEQNFAVMFIDLDGFKKVNDTLGHDSGDELLIQVAGRLKNAVRSTDTVARVGGDEFVVLMNHIENKEQCAIVASKVLKSMQKEFSLTAGPANIGASIGVAMAEAGTVHDMDTVMKRADKAMYRVKNSGKGNFEID
jgi:diguanylate cyclase (GGDEF)-like protein